MNSDDSTGFEGQSEFAADPQLGPFNPPASYRLEPELDGPAPRPIPDVLREGPYGQSQRRTLVGLIAAAVCCLIAAFVPIVRHWGNYLLPLAYLEWIGVGLVGLAAVLWVRQRFSKGPYAYVEHGTPLVGRVRRVMLGCNLVLNDTPTTYQFVVHAEFCHPRSGELLIAELTSNDISAEVKDKRTCSFRVGDYVTLVYLGPEPDGSLRIYGFLGLRPDLGVVNREGEATPSAVHTALGVIAVFAGIFLCVYGALAALRYFPIAMPSAVALPAALGAAASVGIGSGLIYRSRRRKQLKLEARNVAAASAGEAIELQVDRPTTSKLFYTVIIGLGLAFLGAALAGGALFCANAWLDDSQAQRRPVEIDEMIQTTHNFVVREYSIKYHFIDDSVTHTYRTSLDDLERFPGLSPNAIVREGYFGWAWVERLEPEMPAER